MELRFPAVESFGEQRVVAAVGVAHMRANGQVERGFLELLGGGRATDTPGLADTGVARDVQPFVRRTARIQFG